jgi:hypothetical protein
MRLRRLRNGDLGRFHRVITAADFFLYFLYFLYLLNLLYFLNFFYFPAQKGV